MEPSVVLYVFQSNRVFRSEMKGKLMSHIVSSTSSTSADREEVVMTSKMKRSIPGTVNLLKISKVGGAGHIAWSISLQFCGCVISCS